MVTVRKVLDAIKKQIESCGKDDISIVGLQKSVSIIEDMLKDDRAKKTLYVNIIFREGEDGDEWMMKLSESDNLKLYNSKTIKTFPIYFLGDIVNLDFIEDEPFHRIISVGYSQFHDMLKEASTSSRKKFKYLISNIEYIDDSLYPNSCVFKKDISSDKEVI